jgi:hypothetical protein
MTQSPATSASGDQAAVLAVFRRALAREIHALRRHPDLLWQQLHNRLQWQGDPVLARLEPEFERRSVPGATPWLRTRTRARESEALVRGLQGHTAAVFACAYSPDGTRIVSAGGHGDQTLKIWDAETGRCIAVLPLLDVASEPRHHPHRARVARGDRSGSFYLVDLVGITLGPLVVTAVDLGNGPAVRCPVCFERHPLREAWLGQDIDCPGSACQARLRVNPFVAGRPAPR